MMLSFELEELFKKYSNEIDKGHIVLFLKLLSKLRICNYVNQPFMWLIISYIDLTVKIHNLSTFVDVKHSIHNTCC